MNLQRKVVLVCALSAGLAVLSHYAARALYSQTLVKSGRVPHTITTKTNFVDGPTLVATIRYKSDGSWHITSKITDDTFPAEQQIVDVTEGTETFLDPLTRLVYRERLRRGRVEQLRRFPVRCEDALGGDGRTVVCTGTGEKHFGLPLLRATVTENLTDGIQNRREYLVAPTLNFQPLREDRYRNGNLAAHTETIEVTLGEPAPEYFQVPATFRMVERPSEYLGARARAKGESIPEEELREKDEWAIRRKAKADLGR